MKFVNEVAAVMFGGSVIGVLGAGTTATATATATTGAATQIAKQAGLSVGKKLAIRAGLAFTFGTGVSFVSIGVNEDQWGWGNLARSMLYGAEAAILYTVGTMAATGFTGLAQQTGVAGQVYGAGKGISMARVAALFGTTTGLSYVGIGKYTDEWGWATLGKAALVGLAVTTTYGVFADGRPLVFLGNLINMNNPLVRQATWYTLASQMASTANVLLEFNMFGKGVVDPILKLARTNNPDNMKTWLYRTFKDFGQGDVVDSWKMGLQFGATLAPFAPWLQAAGNVFGDGIKWLKDTFLRGGGRALRADLALKKTAEVAIERTVEAATTGAKIELTPTGNLGWQAVKKLLQLTLGTIKEQAIEGPVAIWLAGLGVPRNVAEAVVEFIPDIGGISPATATFNNSTVRELGKTADKMAGDILIRELDYYKDGSDASRDVEARRTELVEALPDAVKSKYTTSTIGDLTLAAYAALVRAPVWSVADQLMGNGASATVTDFAMYATRKGTDITFAEVEAYARSHGVVCIEARTLTVNREGDTTYTVKDSVAGKTHTFTTEEDLNKAVSILSQVPGITVEFVKPDGETVSYRVAEGSRFSVHYDKDGDTTLTRTYENGARFHVTIKPDGSETGTLLDIADCSFEFFDTQVTDSQNVLHDTWRVRVNPNAHLTPKAMEKAEHIAEVVNHALEEMEASSELGYKYADIRSGVNQVSAIIGNLLTDFTVFRIPTGVGKTSFVFTAVAIINNELFPDRKMIFVMHNGIEFNKNTNAAMNALFNRLKIRTVAIINEEAPNPSINPDEAFRDDQGNAFVDMYDVHDVVDDRNGAKKAFREAHVVYMEATAWEFLLLGDRTSKLRDWNKDSAVKEIFKDAKVLYDEFDTVAFIERAQMGVGSRSLLPLERERLEQVFKFLQSVEVEGVKIGDMDYRARLDAYRSLLEVRVKTDSGLDTISYKDYERRKKNKEHIQLVSATFDKDVLDQFTKYLKNNHGLSINDIHTLEGLWFTNQRTKAKTFKQAMYGFAAAIIQLDGSDVAYDPGKDIICPAPGGVANANLHISNPYIAGFSEIVFKENHGKNANLDSVSLSGKAAVTVIAEAIRRAVNEGATFGGFSGTLDSVSGLSWILYGLKTRQMGNSFDYARITDLRLSRDEQIAIDHAIADASKQHAVTFLDGRMMADQRHLREEMINRLLGKEGGFKTVIVKDQSTAWIRYTGVYDTEGNLIRTAEEDITYEIDDSSDTVTDTVSKYRQQHPEERVAFYFNAAATRGVDVSFGDASHKCYAFIDASTPSWFFKQLAGRDRGIYDASGKLVKVNGQIQYHALDVYIVGMEVDAAIVDGIDTIGRSDIKQHLLDMFEIADTDAKIQALYAKLSDVVDNKTVEILEDLAEAVKDDEVARRYLLDFAEEFQMRIDIPDSLKNINSPQSGIEALQASIDRAKEYFDEITHDSRRFGALPAEVKYIIEAQAQATLELDIRERLDEEGSGGIAFSVDLIHMVDAINRNITQEMLPDAVRFSGEAREHLVSSTRDAQDKRLKDADVDEAERRRILGGLEARGYKDGDKVSAAGVRAIGVFIKLINIANTLVLRALSRALVGGSDDDDHDVLVKRYAVDILFKLMDLGLLSYVKNNFDKQGDGKSISSVFKALDILVNRGIVEAVDFDDEIALDGFRSALRSSDKLDMRYFLLRRLNQDNPLSRAIRVLELKQLSTVEKLKDKLLRWVNTKRFLEFHKDDKKEERPALGLPTSFRFWKSPGREKSMDHYRTRDWALSPATFILKPFRNGVSIPMFISMLLKQSLGAFAGSVVFPVYGFLGAFVVPAITSQAIKGMRIIRLAISPLMIGYYSWRLRRTQSTYIDKLMNNRRLKEDSEVIEALTRLSGYSDEFFKKLSIAKRIKARAKSKDVDKLLRGLRTVLVSSGKLPIDTNLDSMARVIYEQGMGTLLTPQVIQQVKRATQRAKNESYRKQKEAIRNATDRDGNPLSRREKIKKRVQLWSTFISDVSETNQERLESVASGTQIGIGLSSSALAWMAFGLFGPLGALAALVATVVTIGILELAKHIPLPRTKKDLEKELASQVTTHASVSGSESAGLLRDLKRAWDRLVENKDAKLAKEILRVIGPELRRLTRVKQDILFREFDKIKKRVRKTHEQELQSLYAELQGAYASGDKDQQAEVQQRLSALQSQIKAEIESEKAVVESGLSPAQGSKLKEAQARFIFLWAKIKGKSLNPDGKDLEALLAIDRLMDMQGSVNANDLDQIAISIYGQPTKEQKGLLSEYADLAEEAIKVSIDQSGNLIKESVEVRDLDDSLRRDVVSSLDMAIDTFNRIREEALRTGNIKLVRALDDALAQGSAKDGAYVSDSSSLIGGSVAENAQSNQTMDQATGKLRPSVVLSRNFLSFIKLLGDYTDNNSQIDRDAIGFLVLEQLLHELSHTERTRGYGRAYLAMDIAEEFENKFIVDRTLVEMLFDNKELLQRVTKIRGSFKPIMGSEVSGHYFGYRIRNFTKIDDTGQRVLMTKDEMIDSLWESNIDQFLSDARNQQAKTTGRARQAELKAYIASLEAIKESDAAKALVKGILLSYRREDGSTTAMTLRDALESAFAGFITAVPATTQTTSQSPVSATDTSAIQQQLDSLKAQAEALSARGQDVAILAAQVDNMIAQVNSGNVDPASIDAIEKQMADIERQLAIAVEAQAPKQSSAGTIDEALLGQFSEKDQQLINDNIEILRAFCAQNDSGVSAQNDADVIAFIQAISMLNDRGMVILESIIHGIKEAQVSGGNPVDYQARFLGITQAQAQTINDNLSGLSRQVDTLNQSGQFSDAQRKQLTDRVVDGIHKFEKQGGSLEGMRKDLQKALKDIVGLPTGLANKLVIDPIFAIMSQVVKPRMAQLETAATEFTSDSAEAVVNIVNAVMIEPGYLPVTRGQALVFESYTVTGALAQSLSSIMDKMPKDVRESISVTVYGENKADAVRLLGKYNITVTGELKAVNTATVVYSKAKLSLQAEHTRFIQVEQLQDIADNMVTAAQVMLAIFNMPFKQFAESMKLSGINIGVSDSDMEALFASAEMIDGIIRIKPVDNDTIRRLKELVGQAA